MASKLSKQALLSALADREYHSGASLGERFAVTRTAIWKCCNQLQSQGVQIESVRGKGYRLDDNIELLEEQLIRQALTPESLGLLKDIELPFVLSSTNQLLMQRVTEERNRGTPGPGAVLIAAEQQTAGKGRHNRLWESPLARNIYASVSWRFYGGAAVLNGLSLAVATVMVDALEQLSYTDIRLKWPNDLLWQERKLAGILLEMVGDADGPCDVVIGIGLNVAMCQSPVEIDQPWVDLSEIGGETLSRNRILAEILNRLLPMLDEFEKTGFTEHRHFWEQRDYFAGREVVCSRGSHRIQGSYLGVDDDGVALVQTASGIQRVSGGEMSMRPNV